MFNPNDPRQLTKLRDAITGSLGEMKSFLDNRKAAYTQFVGKHYKNGTLARVPLPMIAQAVGIIFRNLVATEPQTLCTSRAPEMRPSAYGFELAMNRTLADMDIGRSMKTWAFEAMMAPFGILKVALDVADMDEIEGMPVWTGGPMCEPVLFDDWVHDMSARRIDRIGFCGNRYSVVKQEALFSGVYDPDVVKRITPTEKIDEHSTQNLSRDKSRNSEDYREMLELWDVWLPDEGLVLTLSREVDDLPPLRVVEWDGPKDGPYHFLWFNEVPGNTMPLPPVALWMDIHDLANRLFNKLARQAVRQKNILAVTSDAVKDGKLITTGEDGEGLVVDNPDKVQELSYGGPDQVNFGFVLQLKQLHNYYAGNPEALGGLAAQSATLGQDELLTQSASAQVKSMQEEVDKGTAKVLKAVAHYLLANPVAEVPITKRIEGTTQEVHTVWSPDGQLRAEDIDLVPHSLRRKPPEERLAFANQFMQMMLGALPALQAQGIMPNMEAYIKLVARLSNMPELNDLVSYTQGEMQATEDGVRPPVETTRNYNRSSRGTQTQQGQEQQTIAKLLASGDAA